jgi:hypothetical protein
MNMYYDQLIQEKRENPDQDRVDPHRWGEKYSNELDWFYAEKERRAAKEAAQRAEEARNDALHAEARRIHEERQKTRADARDHYVAKLRPRHSDT